LLITDLDNTLYDWVTYFARSFSAMVIELARILETGLPVLLEEFREVHRKFGDSERPFAAFALPSVRQRFPGLGPRELKDRLDPAFHAFNSQRKRHLRLYDGVATTLAALRQNGVTIVGHTEAMAVNAWFRLSYLGVAGHFKHLYALENHIDEHPLARPLLIPPPKDFIQFVPRAERKPNPLLLLDICRREKVAVAEAAYIGDSMTRDISMARAAGVHSTLALYGRSYSVEDWHTLVAVTHWTEEDVRREEALRSRCVNERPDAKAANFAELVDLFHV